MQEIQIVSAIRKLAGSSHRHKQVIKGIGDDCAILRPRPNEDLVFTSDFVIESQHFTRETHSAADVGHKALARSLSDLAAMGSEPVFCVVSLAVPAQLGGSWVQRFYKGLLTLAEMHKVTLAGGDLARADSVIADVMCCGRVPRGKAILRSGAKPSDRIYITGELGGSAHGLTTRAGPTWRQHVRPVPRVAEGLMLRRLDVSACIDLTDGLALDLYRLCQESEVGAELTGELPVAAGATFDQALHGGEDYELLFTAQASALIPRTLGDVPVTCIGTITRAHPGKLYLRGRRLPAKGFQHFK